MIRIAHTPPIQTRVWARGIGLVIVLALMGWQEGSSAAPASNAKAVRFTFSWPAGMRVPVRLTFTQRYPELAPQVARFQATLVVERKEPNLMISFRGPKVEADISNHLDLSFIGTLQELKFLSVPDFIVSAQGRYGALAPEQSIQVKLRDAFGDSGIVTPDQIDRLVSAAGDFRARNLWND